MEITACPRCARLDLRVTRYEYRMAIAGLLFIATVIVGGTVATVVQWGNSGATMVTSDQ